MRRLGLLLILFSVGVLTAGVASADPVRGRGHFVPHHHHRHVPQHHWGHAPYHHHHHHYRHHGRHHYHPGFHGHHRGYVPYYGHGYYGYPPLYRGSGFSLYFGF